MKRSKFTWLIGLVATLAVILGSLLLFWPRDTGAAGSAAHDPSASLPAHTQHTDHKNIISGPFETGQEVTQACQQCHPDAAQQVMGTTHWTWESQPFDVPWRDEPVTIGKINQINNFCIGSQGNEKKCMSCHVGYSWQEGTQYNFSQEENVDCLACHADAGLYGKGDFGEPAKGVDLVAAAQSVRNPTRENCGKCHFDGGGGNGVKHGDLDETLYFPTENADVHMGRENLQCTDCHRTTDHQIKGKISADNFTVDPEEQVACTDCHAEDLHEDERLDAHVETVACQTCHIPSIAREDPTKVYWDWSTAGQDLPEDHYKYLKIKGSFTYENDYQPTYQWWDGNLAYRYLLGDKIDPSKPTYINLPAGEISDPGSKIFPFKIHVAKQPYDVENNYLLQPITAGKDGFWTNFDWDQAFELAQKLTGLEYSGKYDFAETWMYWPTTHMVEAKEGALQCDDCHSPDGRLDWQALGYPGDPLEWGGRFSK